MKLSFFNTLKFLLFTSVAVQAANKEDFDLGTEPFGFGNKVTGGAGGTEYHVYSLKELRTALNNNGNPNDPKIIYLEAPINGYIYDDGTLMTAENLAPGFTFKKYMECFNEQGTEWLNTDECNEIEKKRKNGMKPLQKQIKVKLTSNTSLIGKGFDTKIEELVLQVTDGDNVIIKDLYIQAPNDIFPTWTMNDGWDCKYDAIILTNATNVWVDNCFLTDGDKPVELEQEYFGEHVERHDGLIDIVKKSNFVTLSNNRFVNHKKTILIGNSDKYTDDRGKLSVTMYNNVFINCWQRMPRLRFGKVHLFNNLFYSDTFDIDSIRYHDDGTPNLSRIFLGLGLESNILSEYNSFNYPRNIDFDQSDHVILTTYGGHIFHDKGSKYNGKEIDIDALAKLEFERLVNKTIAQNSQNGKENPDWVSEPFNTNTFNPEDSYDYKYFDNIDRVNQLIHQVPSWMFDMEISDAED